MGDTTIQPVAAFVPATLQRDQLVSTTADQASTYAAVGRARVADIPGQSGPVSGVRLDLGRKVLSRHESSYFLADNGGVYRSGIGDPWRPVSDRAELQRVTDVLGAVREGAEAQRRAPEQAASIDALTTAMARLPPVITLTSTHPSYALDPPTAAKPVTRAQPGPGSLGSSPDGRVVFKKPSTLESLLGYSIKLSPQVDVGSIRAGSDVSVNSAGAVWVHGQGHMERYSREATEMLSYAWARNPRMMPTQDNEAAHGRPTVPPSEAPPLPLARVQAVVRANEPHPTR